MDAQIISFLSFRIPRASHVPYPVEKEAVGVYRSGLYERSRAGHLTLYIKKNQAIQHCGQWSSIGWGTISPNQAINLLQDQIFFRDCGSGLRNKASDVPVNTVPAARSDMGTHRLQSGIFRHTASAGHGPEDSIQDHGEVYDVTHHASNILLACVKD